MGRAGNAKDDARARPFGLTNVLAIRVAKGPDTMAIEHLELARTVCKMGTEVMVNNEIPSVGLRDFELSWLHWLRCWREWGMKSFKA